MTAPSPEVIPVVDTLTTPRVLNRREALAAISPSSRGRIDELIELSKHGLPQMYKRQQFVHTVRLAKRDAIVARPEGVSLRYSINVALGLSFLPIDEQRRVLQGDTAQDLILATVRQAESSRDTGAVALAAWTAAEAGGIFADKLFKMLRERVCSAEPIATVDCSWALIAGVAGREIGDTQAVSAQARSRLLQMQGPSGLFPHTLPNPASGWLRANIGCFADQVYSTQGLSRLALAEDDQVALAAAEACAARICELQGSDGQWWWHYDVSDGSILEEYPVYSVHQHAMAPMALLDLREAGGTDHLRSIIKGLRWIDGQNEILRSMVSDDHNVIWRKVARREPKKAVRMMMATVNAIKPGLRLKGVQAFFPPNRIDYECRPYELGWLLYAWLSGGTVAALRPTTPRIAYKEGKG